MTTVWVALIGAVGVLAVGVVAPLLLGRQLNRQRAKERLEDHKRQRQDRLEDWERQDLVEKRLNDRQDAVAAKAAETARLLLAANERIAQDTAQTNIQLGVIHTLVNSALSAALQAEIDATMRELKWMRRASGTQPDADERALIDATELRIQELKAVLQDRLEQTRIADSQAAAKEE